MPVQLIIWFIQFYRNKYNLDKFLALHNHGFRQPVVRVAIGLKIVFFKLCYVNNTIRNKVLMDWEGHIGYKEEKNKFTSNGCQQSSFRCQFSQ